MILLNSGPNIFPKNRSSSKIPLQRVETINKPRPHTSQNEANAFPNEPRDLNFDKMFANEEKREVQIVVNLKSKLPSKFCFLFLSLFFVRNNFLYHIRPMPYKKTNHFQEKGNMIASGILEIFAHTVGIVGA